MQETFKLNGDLGTFLGELETYKLAMSIEGDQGAGKTQLSFQLADGFADLGYSVGIFQLEIGANSNIIKRNREQYLKARNRNRVAIAGEAPNGIDTIREYARKFNVIIIDSWTKLDVESGEFDNLRNDFPETIWIVLFQRTSSNKIRGGTKPLYDAGINLEVVKVDDTFVNNYAVATKNRYGMTGIKFNISKQKIA
jgi:nucleoside-triphosphatase THEP1